MLCKIFPFNNIILYYTLITVNNIYNYLEYNCHLGLYMYVYMYIIVVYIFLFNLQS